MSERFELQGRTLTTLDPGGDLLRGVEARAAQAGLVRGRVQVSGSLQHAVVRPGPDGPAVALEGPLELVDAHGLLGPDPLQLRGIVAWSDRGQPRLAAGIIEDGISAGVAVVFEIWSAGVSQGVAEAPRRPASVPRAPRSLATAPAEVQPHLDLGPEIEALEARPTPTPPPPSVGGWGAAVAASRQADRRPLPSPDDLGFDVDDRPELRRGDVLIHPRFGRCKVLRGIMGDKVTVRRPTGAQMDLHLRVVSFRRLPDEDDLRVFQLRIGG